MVNNKEPSTLTRNVVRTEEVKIKFIYKVWGGERVNNRLTGPGHWAVQYAQQYNRHSLDQTGPLTMRKTKTFVVIIK